MFQLKINVSDRQQASATSFHFNHDVADQLTIFLCTY